MSVLDIQAGERGVRAANRISSSYVLTQQESMSSMVRENLAKHEKLESRLLDGMTNDDDCRV